MPDGSCRSYRVAQDWKPDVAVSVNVESATEGFKRVSEALAAACISSEDFARACGYNQEVKPMTANPAPKPDPHDKCRLRLQDAGVVDDYGREVDCVLSVRFARHPDGFPHMEIDVIHPIGKPDPAATRPASAPSEPIYIESNDPIPLSERQRIASEVQEKTGRPVVMLPYGLRRGVAPVEPEERQRLADISRRADLAAASRKGWRWGIVVGALVALTLATAALFTVARVRPEWLVGLAVKQHASADRDSITTPWSPAVLDEHARETEDARAGGK